MRRTLWVRTDRQSALASPQPDPPPIKIGFELSERQRPAIGFELSERPRPPIGFELSERQRPAIGFELSERPRPPIGFELSERPRPPIGFELSERPRPPIGFELSERPRPAIGFELSERPRRQLASNCQTALAAPAPGKCARHSCQATLHQRPIKNDYTVRADGVVEGREAAPVGRENEVLRSWQAGVSHQQPVAGLPS